MADNKATLTHNLIQQWIDSIREFSAQSITFNHLTYIAEEGRFAIDARMKQKFEDGHEWKSWPRDKSQTNLLICLPAFFAEFEKFKIYHGIACKLPS